MSNFNQVPPTDEPFDLEHAPLERPRGFDTDWGGDGTDLDRPVRAHVLAALRPAAGPYEPPLDMLLTLGEVDTATLKQRASEAGIGQQHVPELVRMLRDRSLATDDDDRTAWAPSHALELLKSLDISNVLPDLIPIFDLDFDRFTDEMIDIVASAGVAALPPAIAYLRDRTRWAWGRSRVADILQKIAEQHPEAREEVVATLSDILAGAENDHEQAMTGVMGALLELKATEALPLIRHAFELHKIDETMYGPWGEVLKELGLEPEPDDALIEESRERFEEKNRRMFPQDLRENLEAFTSRHRAQQALAEQREATQKRKQDKARKQKNKRKAASAARKANRKKR